ncbi:acyl-CoA dehydrogenase family protein [Sphingomonas sp. Root710]|uniref:acyl-CoA dehydrogenase family protein n=1 Tax=Sphingomonas sp. Root710 TaxID=1736594 RepID=UPI0009EBB0F7|nr:acyl-CoA dehydrogenase family protein [Sphingomonas sp. Root710]
MDAELDPAQQALRDGVRSFVAKASGVSAGIAVPGRDAATRRENWRAFADNGWLGAALPSEYGGSGGGLFETAIIAQEFGRALVIEPYLGCAVMAAQTLVAGASAQQLARVLPDLIAGKSRVALAYSEPQSRGMPEPIMLRAERAPDGYILHGGKTLVLGGVEADHFIVSAVTHDQPILLLVDAAAPGLMISALELHDGSQAAQLAFDGVFVRGDALLGQPDRALPALRHGLAYGTVALCAELVGIMERAIELSADYLKRRTQFGVPIGSFQTLQHRLADMAAEMELARSMLFALLLAVDGGDEPTIARLVSQAKSLVGRAAKHVCGQAIQMHGGIAMTDECPIAHYFKRAVVADILLGSSDSHDSLRARTLENTLKTAELRWYELLPVWWTAQQGALA